MLLLFANEANHLFIRPKKMIKVLDIFCGAGGCSTGFHLAGFEVTGVDNAEQPNYPFTFVKSDFRDLSDNFINQYDLIHCSPCCQGFSSATGKNKIKHIESMPFINICRQMFSHKPLIIENVENSPLRKDLILHGLMFGLKVIRARVFEFHNLPVPLAIYPITLGQIKKMGLVKKGICLSVAGNGANKGQKSKLNGLENLSIIRNREIAMDISWIKNGSYEKRLKEINNAIPYQYTKFIGEFLMQNYFIWQSNQS